MAHPAPQLDDTVHQRVRLGILAVLQQAKRAYFSFPQDVPVRHGVLSEQISGYCEHPEVGDATLIEFPISLCMESGLLRHLLPSAIRLL